MNQSDDVYDVCLHSFKSQLETTFGFMKERGLDYIGMMNDDSFYTGEANEKYLKDDKKIFSLTEENEVTETAEILNKVQSEDYFVAAVIKKDDQVIFNDFAKGNPARILKSNRRLEESESVADSRGGRSDGLPALGLGRRRPGHRHELDPPDRNEHQLVHRRKHQIAR